MKAKEKAIFIKIRGRIRSWATNFNDSSYDQGRMWDRIKEVIPMLNAQEREEIKCDELGIKELKLHIMLETKNGGKNARLLQYQSFKRLLKVNHIKYRSLRHTRHTFATTMIKKAINDGFSIMWVSKILGHSSLQTTLRVYTRHIQDEHLKIDRQMQIF